MTHTINPEKLALLNTLPLRKGAHHSFEDGACAMEWVAWLADEGHTDAPTCASPVLRAYTIRLNDRWDDDRRQALKPYLIRMIGTGTDGLDQARRDIAARHTVALIIPWLRLAGLHAESDALAAAGSEPAALRAAVVAARDKAWEVRSARRKRIRDAVAERGKGNVADVAVVAVAAADADVVAVADVAVDADVVVVAVAAADADVVADVVAVAVAAADADHWETRAAVRDALTKHYAEHPALQPVRDLAKSQEDTALTLLDALIDAKEVTA